MFSEEDQPNRMLMVTQDRRQQPIRRLDTLDQDFDGERVWFPHSPPVGQIEEGHLPEEEEGSEAGYPSSFERILQSDYAKNLVDLSPADTRLIKDLAVNITSRSGHMHNMTS